MSSNRRPHILLTNDDGIDAPGLHALAEVLAPHFDLTIVAPHIERSATGHAITVMKDLRLKPHERNGECWGWSFEGGPADCVKMGVRVIEKERPIDFVVAGINRGQNLGVNIHYSGTVAAAREGVVHGLPSVAFSVAYRSLSDVRFDTAAKVALEVTRRVVLHGLPPGVMLNVNVPPLDYEAIQGFAITRQGNSGFRDRFERLEGSREDEALYRNVGDRFEPSVDAGENLDDHALKENRVSITPLHIDTTAHGHLDALDHFEKR